MNKISDWTVRLLTLATLATGVTCGGRSALLDPLADMDGDGVTNEDDCAPCDPTVSGDKDDDGYYDARCWDEESNDGDPIAGCGMVSQYFAPNDDGPELRDCDDEDACVHPLDPPTEAGASPPCLVVPEQPRGDDVTVYECAFIDLSWASDGKDNDCDGLVDGVSDYDGDGVISQDWAEAKGLSFEPGELDCDDCRALVRPTIDERATVDVDGESCPIYAYDDVDNDCDGQDVTDVDQDGYVGGWHPDSPCGLQVNATLAEGMSPDATTPDNGTLIDRLLAAGQDAVDCEDTTLEKHPDAYERCDDEDWNCSFPRDEDWSQHAEPDYTFDGFTAIEEGAFGYAEDQPAYYIYVDIDGVGMGASPEEAMGPTPDLDEDTSLSEPDSLLTPLRRAAYYLDRCPVLRIAPGTYQESLTLSRLGTEDADTGGPDSGDTDGGDTDGGDTGDLESPSLDSREVAFTAPDGGVTWDGVQAPALSALQAAGDALRVEGIEFIGGDDVDTSYEGSCVVVYAGGLRVQDTRFTGCESWREGGGLFVAATEDVTLENVSFDACSSRAAGGGLYLATLQEATLSGVRASGSSAAGDGGGVYVAATGAGVVDDLTLEQCTSAGDGGGAYLASLADLSSTGILAEDNRAGGSGGGVYMNAANLYAEDLSLYSNQSSGDGGGGALFSDGAFVLNGATIGNTTTFTGDLNAGGDGGGLLVDANIVDIQSLSSSGARADGRGGSLFVNSRNETILANIVIECEDDAEVAASEGGGIGVQSSGIELGEISVSSCRSAGNGGGLSLVASGNLALNGALSLTGNRAGGDGGGAALFVEGAVEGAGDLTLSRNQASLSGGGLSLYSAGGVTLRGDLNLDDNTAGGDGGGAYVLSDKGTTWAGTLAFDSNEATHDGGGLWLFADEFDISNLEANQNNAGSGSRGDGGGACLGTLGSSGSATIRQGSFSSNTAVGDGGGLWLEAADAQLDNLSLSANKATSGSGGGAHIDADTLSAGTLSATDNTASEDGGGLWLDLGTLTMDDTTLSSNTASGDGGGAHIDAGAIDAADTTLSSNRGSDGGGLWVQGDQIELNVLNATSNRASRDGGAIYMVSLATSTGGGDDCDTPPTFGDKAAISAASFTTNRAEKGSGGAMYLTGGGGVLLDENTLTSNQSDSGSGGGIYASELELFQWEGGSASGDGDESNAGEDGGGLALHVIDHAIVRTVDFVDLVAEGAGGGVAASTVTCLELGQADPEEKDGFTDEFDVSVRSSFAGSVGGGVYLRSIDDARLDHVWLDKNDCTAADPEDAKGAHLYMNQVDATIDYLLAGAAGADPELSETCGGACPCAGAIYQSAGDVTLSNARIKDNQMADFAVILGQTARMDARNVLVSGQTRAGGIRVKNSATLFTQSVTVRDNVGGHERGDDDPEKDYGIAGGPATNLILGCTVVWGNAKGVLQKTGGNTPNLFCLVSMNNGDGDKPENDNLEYDGRPETDEPVHTGSAKNELICFDPNVEDAETTDFETTTLSFATRSGESLPHVDELTGACSACLHSETATGGGVTSEEMYPIERVTDEDETETTPGRTFKCGGAYQPLGYDPYYDGLEDRP